jgi:hypothetical protein
MKNILANETSCQWADPPAGGQEINEKNEAFATEKYRDKNKRFYLEIYKEYK